jgi:hypothetical protein
MTNRYQLAQSEGDRVKFAHIALGIAVSAGLVGGGKSPSAFAYMSSCAKPMMKPGKPRATLFAMPATKPSLPRRRFLRLDSVGQRRMAELHHGRRDRLEISPNLWAGVGLLRGGAGTALVGDPQTVAARMKEYMAFGIDTFIMSGYPHLEEAYRFAELVFPLLPLQARRQSDPASVNTGPFGETIANGLPLRRQVSSS